MRGEKCEGPVLVLRLGGQAADFPRSSARDLLLIHCPSGIVPRPADFLLGIPGPAGVPPLSSVEFGEGALGGEGAVSPVSPGLSFLSSLGGSSQHPLCCQILSPL